MHSFTTALRILWTSPVSESIFSVSCLHCASFRDNKAPASIEPATVAPASPLISETEPTSAATIQQDADRHLVTHFESVQAISTTTTTPSLLPMLLQSLTRNTDHKPLLELLRSGTPASNLFVPSSYLKLWVQSHLKLWVQGSRRSSGCEELLQTQSPPCFDLLDYFVCITCFLGTRSG